ncbi:amino acid permease [Lactococcus fujiensis]|uniref:Amino acid transporter n=1 Tax=Lactococcus fujiensis JCM 16395 TaxID=1291764 RepID=A0A2A5RN14_9LACT|nr:amino acid permease [Lactococcus fujiensis]PCS00698.1 amino acid transporter [Lactococcus fujiensis JCM 16395]
MKNTETPSQRGLKNRHVQLIAIAGTIGTGLFLGAGKSISLTGPSILLVYLIIGALMFILLRTIGEMLYIDPEQHSFLNFVSRYLGDKTGYFISWTYWLVVIFTAMAELTAIGSYIHFWLPQFPIWLSEIFVLALLTALNTLNAKFFGETEFWFGMIKIVAIVGMILTALILMLTNFQSGGVSVGFQNITDGFKFFPNGVSKFFESFQMVMFAFVAMEFIGMTAAETEEPRKTLKLAINQIPLRIILFYIGALVAIMCIYRWQDIPADQSPFVMIFQLIGIKWAATLVNFVVLTSAASALNSALFSTTRNLYALSKINGDKILIPFTKMSRSGIPIKALLFTSGLIFFTPFISMIPGISNGFVFITSVATNLFLVVYIISLITYLKFRKSSDFDPHGFVTPWAKVLVPITILAFALIFVSLFFFSDTIIPAIGSLIWIFAFGIIAKFRPSKNT